MYNYFTKERKLDNLIWVLCHSGEIDADFRVDKQYFDIAGPDTYSKDAQQGLFHAVEKLYGKGQLLPLHECGTIPDPDECIQNNTLWSWWMLWHTSFVTKYNKEDLRRIYHHPSVITLDELK